MENKRWSPDDIEGLKIWIEGRKLLKNKWGWPIGLRDLTGSGNHLYFSKKGWFLEKLKNFIMFWR